MLFQALVMEIKNQHKHNNPSKRLSVVIQEDKKTKLFEIQNRIRAI
jgi:hypothetical protein